MLHRPIITGIAAFLGGSRVPRRLGAVGLGGWIGLLGGLITATADVRYDRDIKPLFRSHCTACHGALKQNAGLRLDTVQLMLKGGKSGPALERGAPDRSALLSRVTTTDLAERMPPEHEGQPFSPAEIETLKAWIAAGAPAPEHDEPESDPRDHWAFRTPVRPAVPATTNPGWVRNPIDAFIAREHTRRGVQPQAEAPRDVLVRRLWFDLIGLPPTEDELAVARHDTAPDWYERTVDRLLDDPRHGERWARHWMDVWRYSDWWGLGDQLRNSQKHIWHWRDWIVESLNADVPYDEMVRQMIAADELYPADLEKLRATGFLARNYFLFNRNQWLEETVEHVSKGFLGLTMNCAKCHDHKYDPFTQVDFYRMRAFFEPYHARIDLVPGEADPARDGIPRAYDGLPDLPTYRFVRGQESAPDKSKVIAPGVPDLLRLGDLSIQVVNLPAVAAEPERRAGVLESHIEAARARIGSLAAAAVAAREKLEAHRRAPAATNVVAEAQAEFAAAEAERALAEAELESVRRRAAAMQAGWAARDAREGPNAAALAAAEREAITVAIRSVRTAELMKTRRDAALADRKRLTAPADKREAAEKELKTAREAVEQATRTLESPIADGDTFARLPGAHWTATRFFDSTKDDPAVAFRATSTGRRRALAGWLTDRRNPLVARVAVNHLWNRHFGTPLVPVTFDFGRKNPEPIHRELVDWLAVELVENGWSLKHLHRRIVCSAAYRMGSSLAGAEANLAADPDNAAWWRRTPVRLEAEAVRDALLALGGQLDPARGGPSIPAANQDTSRRRSLYFFHSNNERNLFLTTFDVANVKECYRREQTIVPQQALALSNSRLALDAAGWIATRLETEPPVVSTDDDEAFVRRAFRRVLGFEASEAEVRESRAALTTWRQLPKAAGNATPRDPARVHLVWALLNHNDFVTLR